MIELEAVQSAILGAVPSLAPVELPVSEALGLVLAREVASGEPVPRFANTAMDGYAVRASDTAGASAEEPVQLRVVGELPAGRAPTTEVGAGEAIRIMTGAPMPGGADAVVMVERTERDGDGGVRIYQEATPGDHVRRGGRSRCTQWADRGPRGGLRQACGLRGTEHRGLELAAL